MEQEEEITLFPIFGIFTTKLEERLITTMRNFSSKIKVNNLNLVHGSRHSIWKANSDHFQENPSLPSTRIDLDAEIRECVLFEEEDGVQWHEDRRWDNGWNQGSVHPGRGSLEEWGDVSTRSRGVLGINSDFKQCLTSRNHIQRYTRHMRNNAGDLTRSLMKYSFAHNIWSPNWKFI